MSWPLEEWKGELSSQALRKVTECERQLEKLGQERRQRRLQLNSVESALHKQQQQLEDERQERASLRREAQSLREEASLGERGRQRLRQELQMKEALVCSLEGQLVAARTRIDNLEQELKRLEAELERNLRSPPPSPSVSQLQASLPNTSSPRPRDHQGSQREDLQRKSWREAEERPRLGTEVDTLGLQNSRAQSGPTNFPSPDHQPPGTPASRVRTSSVFPWEERATQQPPSRPLGPDPTTSHPSPEEDGLREENRVLRGTVAELEMWLQSQEKELKGYGSRLQELQSGLEESEAQLTAKHQTLSHNQQLLSRASQGQQLANAKCVGLEHRLKQVTAELECLRQNADSGQRSAQQRVRQREREHQQELAEQQCLYQGLEQEIREAQATASRHIHQLQSEQLELQATVEKVTAQKRLVDRELQELEEKVDWAVGELAAYQQRDSDLQREKQFILETSSTCEGQSPQRLLQLQAQLTRTEQDLTWSQTSREQMRGENQSLLCKVEALQREIEVQREGLSVSPETDTDTDTRLLSWPPSPSRRSDSLVVVSTQGVLPSQEVGEGSPTSAQPPESGAACGVTAVTPVTEAGAGLAAVLGEGEAEEGEEGSRLEAEAEGGQDSGEEAASSDHPERSRLRMQLLELERRCEDLTGERERAERGQGQAQRRLHTLQATLHRETQQLTAALEVQSQNTEHLLLSVEERDGAIAELRERLSRALAAVSCLQKENVRLQTNPGGICGQDTGPHTRSVLGRGSPVELVERLRDGRPEEVFHYMLVKEGTDRLEGGSGRVSGQRGTDCKARGDPSLRAEDEEEESSLSTSQLGRESVRLAEELRLKQAQRAEEPGNGMHKSSEGLKAVDNTWVIIAEEERGRPPRERETGRTPTRETDTRIQTEGQAGGRPAVRVQPWGLGLGGEPAELAQRRGFLQHLSVAFDSTEYEPYGLPDVVQKGFGDIPAGPLCPHVLRRALLSSLSVPETAAPLPNSHQEQ